MSCRGGLLRLKLKIEVRDKEGKIVAVRKRESDIILNNFKTMLTWLMVPYEKIAVNVYRGGALVNFAGTSRTMAIWGNRTIGTGIGLNFTGCHYDPEFEIGVRIRIGTSMFTPTRDDYKLGSEVTYGTPTKTTGADYISWAISFTLPTAQDIAEAGLSSFYQLSFGGSSLWEEFLLFRDTFTPISVPAGGTISVTYTLTL